MYQTTPKNIFLCYSRQDRKYLEELRKVMSPLVANKILSVWWDGKIKSGQNWREEIAKALTSVSIGVLFVSPDFLDSDFIEHEELPYLLNAAEEREVKLFWILVKPALFEHTELESYQAAHDVSKPLDSLRPAQRNKVLVEICRKLLRELQEPAIS